MGYMAVIFALSSTPGRDLPNLHGKDHLVHFFEFGILGALVICWAFGRFGGRYPLKAILFLSALFVSLYGASDEFHQLFVPGRCCELWDWVADTTGGVVFMLLTLSVLRRIET